VTTQAIPRLSGLATLAQKTGLDIRPTLLRVLTDLYVLKPAHSDEEERHYVELAMRLLDGVDVDSRIALAERLAAFPGAPAPIIRRLARDVLDVAAPVLRHFEAFEQGELIALSEEMGPAYAVIIAQRTDFQALVVHTADAGYAATDSTEGETPEAPEAALEPPPTPDLIDEITPLPDPEPRAPRFASASDLTALFLSSDSADRKLILLNLGYSSVVPAPSVSETRAREAIRRLERAALSRQPHIFAGVASDCLGLSSRFAQNLIDDPSGEPIIVLAKALRMPSDILQRVLLFLNPVIGESVRHVYDLAALYDEISEDAALRLVAIWKSSQPRRQSAHESIHWDDEIARARTNKLPAIQGTIDLLGSGPRRYHGGQAVRS
jgi:hypothetical protein